MAEESYILFYSTDCRFSNKFMRLLQKFPEVNSKFQKYAIESLQQLPAGLRNVPTIMEMHTQKMYDCQQAFDWLESKVKNSFEASMDISGKGDNSLGMSFISKDEKNYSKDYSVLGNEMYNGTAIDPKMFDGDGKPLRRGPQNQSNVMPVSPTHMTEQQFQQMNQAMNQQVGMDMDNSVLDANSAQAEIQRRQQMNLPPIQRNDQAFNQNINQQVGGGGISQQDFQSYQQQFQQQFGSGGGGGQFGGGGGGVGGPPLPAALQPIDVSKSSSNLEQAANELMNRRNSEVPQPMKRMGDGNSVGGRPSPMGMGGGGNQDMTNLNAGMMNSRNMQYNPNVF